MEKGGYSMEDAAYMAEALALARAAAEDGEVPVGAVIVWDDGRIVGRGRNRREKGKNALYHAEIEAIDEACKALGGWRLHKATIYVTMEPCPMCAGALMGARVKRIVYGTRDENAGALGTICDLSTLPRGHRPEVVPECCGEESRALLADFFKRLRRTGNE